jgi:TonB family protein
LKDNKKYRINGIIGTVIFHMMIVALLIFLGFTTALPLPGEEGVEVNLGSDMEGLGKIQPIKSATVEKILPPPTARENIEEEIVTQDIEPAPVIESKEEEITKEKPVIKPPAENIEPEESKKEPEINPAALYKGKSKDPNTSNSEGITGKEGDQGKPEGTIDAKEYLGKGGFGDGNNWDLEGRKPSFLPKPASTFQENGTVVVQITVNKYGKVIKAVAIDKGSNTTNTTLRRLAEQAALKAIFNADMNAAEFQRGTITYHFVVKN